MLMPLVVPALADSGRNRRSSEDALRQEALERLYRRREVVDDLIQRFEEYELVSQPRKATVIPFTAGRKCWSGYAR